MSGRLYSVRLTWPDGTVLQVRREWQGTVLGIAVDLSVLPYLLRLLLGPTPSGRPRSVVPSRPRPCWSRKSSEQRSWRILGRRKGSESDYGPTMARPSGRGFDQISWPEVPVGDRIVVLTCHCVSGSAQALSLRRLLGQILQGNGSIGNPGFTNPTQPIQAETYFAQIGCAVEQALWNSSAWENTNKQNSFC